MTDNRTTELLSCPFCGGEPTAIETYPGRGEIYCGTCDVVLGGNEAKTPEELTEAWNTRTASGDDFSRAVHDGHLWRRVRDHIKCRICGLNIESVIPLDGCNGNAISYCPNCGTEVVER